VQLLLGKWAISWVPAVNPCPYEVALEPLLSLNVKRVSSQGGTLTSSEVQVQLLLGKWAISWVPAVNLCPYEVALEPLLSLNVKRVSSQEVRSGHFFATVNPCPYEVALVALLSLKV